MTIQLQIQPPALVTYPGNTPTKFESYRTTTGKERESSCPTPSQTLEADKTSSQISIDEHLETPPSSPQATVLSQPETQVSLSINTDTEYSAVCDF